MIFSKTYHSNLSYWEEKETIPFNELILSWNGIRPKQGKWTFWVSLKENEWLKYAEWSPNSQKTFKCKGDFAQSYQDVVTPKTGLCKEFKVKVEGEELSQLHSLTVCVSNLTNHSILIPQNLPPVLLKDVPRQSQMLLDHPRNKDLCSPTATTTAINTIMKSRLDPRLFASRSHDDEFDIYGNWILNIAEAYNHIKSPCHVERLADFSVLHAHLLRGHPVVVSVKGTLPGAPKPYNVGHLICVIGYENGKVFCIDSGFPTHETTFIGYDLEDFLKAWGTRFNLAYVFKR